MLCCSLKRCAPSHPACPPGSPLMQRCLEAGARLAQPGEFTLRAFLNGRLDLSQAESVAEVRIPCCTGAGMLF